MNHLNKVFAIGFHHQSLSTEDRSKVFINEEYFWKSAQSRTKSLNGLTILQTCNRIELYGQGNLKEATQLFSTSAGLPATYSKKLVERKGLNAVQHIFNVASGLDSKLVGDLEILGQFRKAFRTSKKYNRLNGYMERLANHCIQAAKSIRSNTELTSGTTSLSYAAIQLLMEKNLAPGTKILLVGTGKFGTTIAKNLRTYLPNLPLTLCNRTYEKSEQLAKSLNCEVIPFEALKSQLKTHDVLIGAVGNQGGLIHEKELRDAGSQLIVDLSVPSVFQTPIHQHSNYYSIDAAAEIVNRSLEKRASSIPQAQDILLKHMHEFIEWSRINEQSSTIKEWKQRVEQATNACPHLREASHAARKSILKKSMGDFVKFMKQQTHSDVHSDIIIQDYLEKYPVSIPGEACCNTNASHSSKCQLCPKALK